MKKLTTISLAAAVILVFSGAANVAFSAILYTNGASDGIGWMSKDMQYVDRGIATDGATLDGMNFSIGGAQRYWQMPILQFPIAAFAGQTIESATLKLYCTAYSGYENSVRVLYAGGGNGTIIYEQANSGSDITGGNITSSGWKLFDVKSQVQNAVDNSYSWVVFNVRIEDGASASFIASENTDSLYTNYHPQLTVIPEPATICLLGLGALSLINRKK